MDIFENLENLNVSEACFEDILSILEEYINEVTVGKLARAIENVKEKRKQDAENAIQKAKEAREKYLQNRHDDNAYIEYDKARDAADKAKSKHENSMWLDAAKLPKNSKVSANKLFKAAKKVENSRTGDFVRAVDGGWKTAIDRTSKRFTGFNTLRHGDPVKSRKKEA